MVIKAKFSLDSSKQPKTIDYQVMDSPTRGQTHLGIFEVNDDTARFCFGAPGAERPTDFTTKVGDRRTMSTWKRAKPAAPAPK